tara:strand:- start:24 stop:413 length:390 start_codon:yes stop_codon:yes gene_type:complete
MIFEKTQKIMNTGIGKYSRINEVTEEQTQILVKAEGDEKVNYTICKEWKPLEVVSFKQIMDVRVDILGFEMLASPFLRKSVDMYSKYYESDDVNLFIFKKDSKLGIAVYEKNNFKEILTLEKQFERLGI